MTPEEILHAFGTSDDFPDAALRAAVAQSAALLPHILRRVERAAADVTLLPADAGIVYYGMMALAAARETALCQPFLRLLRLPEERLDPYFDFDPLPSQSGILLSVFDGDADAVLAALEDPRVAGGAKWALFAAAARLVWEGRIARQPFLDLLDRFDREEMAPPDDLAWGGWQDAIRYLGLVDMAPRVVAGRAAGRLDGWDEEEAEIFAEGLAWSAEHPGEPRAFEEEGVAPIDDPTTALSDPDEEDGAADAEEPDSEPGPHDPEALDDRELAFLGRFLWGPEASGSTMGLEVFDGFLTALAIGPARVPPEEWRAALWGEGGPPHYADEEQRRYVEALLDRHAAAIFRRADAGRPPEPYVFAEDRRERPLEWAIGFFEGVDLGDAAWRRLFEEPDADALLGPLEALADERSDPEDGAFEALPEVLAGIQDYWRRPARVPARSTKVGRNDPCPCGSGKKYKKCHGANA
jgi:uncharacterized protein